MERRLGLRGRTDFGVIAQSGCSRRHCRGIEVSPTGIVIDHGRDIATDSVPLLVRLELRLPERINALVAWGRPVWARGRQQALRIVRMNDADRLTLAEHLDLLSTRGALLG